MTTKSGQPLRVGLCGVGLDTYWPQFEGLRQRLNRYVAQVAARLARPGVQVVNLGLVDSVNRSDEAGRRCRREDIDVLFLYVTTYALSNAVECGAAVTALRFHNARFTDEVHVDADSVTLLGRTFYWE